MCIAEMFDTWATIPFARLRMLARLHGLNQLNATRLGAAGEALEAGRLDEAARLLQAVHAEAPDHPEVLRLQAGLLGQRGHHAEAVRNMRHALTLRGDDPLYYNTLGTLLGSAGDYDEAIQVLQHSCKLQPGLALAWYNLGVMLTRAVRNDEAMAAMRQALALEPAHAGSRALLADLLRTQGHTAEAEQTYRTLLQSQPWSGVAWWGLADLKHRRFGADDIPAMQAALARREASVDDRIAIGFALAKAYDDAGRFAESLQALHQAHALAWQRRPWNAAAMSGALARIRQAFVPPPAAAPASLGREVIFIVSLPRSGSTLVEQILASHSQVEGAGELPDLPQVIAEESRRRGQPFPRWVGAMQAADWQRLGERYLERTAHWRRARPMFTDKLPNNWMYLGAIRAMLPGAHVIGCRRDPLETCFSCYRQYMQNSDYTNRFEDLAAFWHDYDISLREAHRQSAAHVHEHVYEDLLARPEQSIRALLVSCGLAYEPACLDFHANTRTVRSPSATQVRQPLRGDTQRNSAYGPLLDPLRHALAAVCPRHDGG
jgi:tetratricopeptide (TPR) repeat protein